MHFSDSLGSRESLRDTREWEDFLVDSGSFQGLRSQRAAQQGQRAQRLRSPTWKLKCLALIFSLLPTSSNLVLALSVQLSISEFSLCPNAFGGGLLTGLFPKGGAIGPPCTIQHSYTLCPVTANSENPLWAQSLYVCLSVLSLGHCITSVFAHPFCGTHKQDSQTFWIHLTPLPMPVASHWHAAHALHNYELSAYPRPRQQCTRTADFPRSPGASLSPGFSSLLLFARCILKVVTRGGYHYP